MLARVARDLGDVAVTVTAADDTAGTPTTIDLPGTAMPIDDAVRAGWSLAQWSVAVAASVGLDAVTVGDVTWTRAEPTWQPTGAPALAPGQVRLTVVG